VGVSRLKAKLIEEPDSDESVDNYFEIKSIEE
jgi:hypothetical protein